MSYTFSFNGRHGNTVAAYHKGVTFRYNCYGNVIVYTDGACEFNGHDEAKAGIGVWFGDEHPFNVSEPVRNGRPTNNVAEVQAATRALKILKGAGEYSVCLVTDSGFLVKAVNEWMDDWVENDWFRPNGSPVKNKKEFQALDIALYEMDFVFKHVPSHVGIYGNEEADRLAHEGADLY